jgi:alpha-D-ribose 1-methylphosphonate 5-triphosphate synthase subunit PhnG
MARPGDEGGITACSRTLRTELLSVADADELIGLADRCLQGCEGWPPPELVGPPEVGVVSLAVREPVVGERFLLTDVLATRAQVHHRGQVGWAMRVGDAPAATLAAAICDAEAESGTGLAEAVEELCWATARAREIEDAAEWAELAATEVRFEELT